MRHKLFERAQQQLIEIWIYTEGKWGSKQADKYIDGLHSALTQISDNPSSWRKVRGKRFAGVYFFRYEQHVVFFKQFASGDIGIISILHEKMDLPLRLLDDLNETF